MLLHWDEEEQAFDQFKNPHWNRVQPISTHHKTVSSHNHQNDKTSKKCRQSQKVRTARIKILFQHRQWLMEPCCLMVSFTVKNFKSQEGKGSCLCMYDLQSITCMTVVMWVMCIHVNPFGCFPVVWLLEIHNFHQKNMYCLCNEEIGWRQN